MNGDLLVMAYSIGIVRVLAILSGLISLYLGYRLFAIGVFSGGGEARFEALKTNKVYIRSSAPGTFFALFGSLVIAVTIIHQAHFASTSTDFTEPVKEEPGVIPFNGTGQVVSSKHDASVVQTAGHSPFQEAPPVNPVEAVPAFGSGYRSLFNRGSIGSARHTTSAGCSGGSGGFLGTTSFNGPRVTAPPAEPVK